MPYPIEESDSAVLDFLDSWVRLLADDRIEEALATVENEPIPRRDYGWNRFLVRLGLREPSAPFLWTPENLQALIGGYGSLEKDGGYRVSDPDRAEGTPNLSALRVDEDDEDTHGAVHPSLPYSVYWFTSSKGKPGRCGWAHLSYPINGRWSDLSSEFHLDRTEDGILVTLERIEVM